jgi:CBS domain-containing protein
MQVSDILESKGSRIVSVGADSTAANIATLLKTEQIGTVLVLGGEQGLLGIVSERDIVRAIAEQGESALQLSAADLMSRSVVTCAPDTSTLEIMEQMFENQIRHLPVTSNGALVGIISIGDVVRAVHSEMKWMTKVLHDQVVTSAGWATDDEV